MMPLEARRITKVFPGTTALDAVDVRLDRGVVRALIGENGAGKSTLVNILAGVEQPTAGELRLDGKATRFASARDAIAQGIGVIHQELQLFPDLTVAENLFVGRERCTPWATLDRRAEIDATRRVPRSSRTPSTRESGWVRCRSDSSRSSRLRGRSSATCAC